ncbi:hypothetical protein N9C88_03625 [Candidatus Pseudothioglobus singularis]|nr:hypothetical protein [Candidatus Pseudothioglobus singularis]
MNITTIFITMIFISVMLILPILSSHFRKNNNLLIVYYFVILLYQIVAFTNAYWFRTIGADMDANSFHVLASDISNFGVFHFSSDANLYMNILGLLYWLTTPSHIIGGQLSILAISISIIILVSIINLLKLDKFQTPIIFTYAALPTMFTLGALTLREPIQIFLLITATFFGIKMKINSKMKLINFSLMVIFTLAAGLFHKAIFLFGSIYIFAFMVWNIDINSDKYKIKKFRLLFLLLIPIFMILFFYFASNSSISGSELFRKILSLEIMEAISKHRLSTPIGRASYEIAFETYSLFSVLYSTLLIYVNYLFTPFIWQVSSLTDIYAFIEATAHLILIYYSLKLWRSSEGITRSFIGLFLILFFIMTFMWALGTTNYGTGMRHKMISWWLLALMGVPLLYSKITIMMNKISFK